MPAVEMETSAGAIGPAMRFFEKRPPIVMVCLFAAAAGKAVASASGVSGVAARRGDKSLRYLASRVPGKSSRRYTALPAPVSRLLVFLHSARGIDQPGLQLRPD